MSARKKVVLITEQTAQAAALHIKTNMDEITKDKIRDAKTTLNAIEINYNEAMENLKTMRIQINDLHIQLLEIIIPQKKGEDIFKI